MHIVYLGIMTRPEDIGKIGETSIAGNKFQYNLLKHLSCIDGVKLDIISFHPFKAPHKSKKLFIRTTKEKIFDNVNLWQVGYINLPIIKQLILPWKTLARLKKTVAKSSLVMAYDMYPTQGIPLSRIKKKVNGRTVCLLADLSIGGVNKQRGINRFLRRLFDRSTLNNIKKCDKYIVLNENVAKTYAPHAKYLVVDGGVEPTEFENNENNWNGKTQNIVYTGALVEYSGIMNLVKAFSYIERNDIFLDIYGEGVLRPIIQEIAKNDPRIRYHGTVTNPEALKAQQTSWALINPRPVDNSIAKVTFPSKIFEYLMSGRPVASTMLNGFSSDYDDLLIWINDDSPQGLAQAILKMSETDNSDLTQMANNAKTYLIHNKTWKINAEKIHYFLLTD